MSAPPQLSPGAAALVRRTLRRAAAQVGLAAARGEEVEPRPPAEGLPAPGAVASRDFVVQAADLASSMGHPDPAMTVLGSPRIALWFEIAASELLPGPGGPLRHVGVGILVHHLGRAEPGERVRVDVRVDDVSGRSAVFACSARVGERLVALGTHHRVVLARAPG